MLFLCQVTIIDLLQSEVIKLNTFRLIISNHSKFLIGGTGKVVHDETFSIKYLHIDISKILKYFEHVFNDHKKVFDLTTEWIKRPLRYSIAKFVPSTTTKKIVINIKILSYRIKHALYLYKVKAPILCRFIICSQCLQMFVVEKSVLFPRPGWILYILWYQTIF